MKTTLSFPSLDLPTFPRVRPWQVLAMLAMMLMELSWVVPWYRHFTLEIAPVSRLRVYVVLGIMFLVAYLLVLGTGFLRMTGRVRQISVLFLLVISVILCLKALLYSQDRMSLSALAQRVLEGFNQPSLRLPVEFTVILTVLMVWWRGMTMADHRLGPLSIGRGFRMGIVLLVVIGLFSFEKSGDVPSLELNVFLFAGLVAMGAARLSSLSLKRGGRRSPFDRNWLVGIGILAGGVIVFGAVLAVLAAGPLSTLVAQVIRMVFGALFRIIVLILAPLLILVVRLLSSLIEWLQSLNVIEGYSIDSRTILDSMTEMQGVEQIETSAWILDLLGLIKSLLLWGILIMVVVFILVRLQRLVRISRKDMDDERDWLLGSKNYSRLLRMALQRRLKKLLEGIENLRNPSRRLAAARIRRIYSKLLDLSADLGAPRRAPETPQEFLSGLGNIFPTLNDELLTITQAYVRVRYGEVPETQNEIEAVESAWMRVQAKGEEKKRAK